MRTHSMLVAAALAAVTVTLPGAASPAAGMSVSTITTDSFTSATVDFEAVHTVSDGVADGGISHEDSWVGRLKVRTADGLEITCLGEVDRAQSSESPSRDFDHIVLELTSTGSVDCGRVELTFARKDDGIGNIGLDAGGGPQMSVAAVDTNGDGAPDQVVAALDLDGHASVAVSANVTGTIHSPFTELPSSTVAFVKNARKAKTNEATLNI